MEDIAAVLDKAPLGFGFRPTDEELVEYLRHKLLGDDDRFNIFPVIDLCKVEPWQVPGLPIIKSDDPQRFFFSPVDYKYSNSKRVNRTTKCGFWKSTGQDRYIKVSETDDVIWTKKTLVYYEGRVPNGVKSNWVIHEYHAVTFPEKNQRRFVLCHLKYKAGKGGIDASICDEGEPSSGGHIASSDHENMATEERVPPVDVLPEMRVETIFQPMHQEERDLTPLQQSPNSIEQQASPAGNAYFKNENSFVQTPFETIKEGNEFPTSILPPTHQSSIDTVQEASLTSFSTHNGCSKDGVCNMQTPVKNIEEGNEFSTSNLILRQELPIDTEQEASILRNKDCDLQTPSETIEEGNEFLTFTEEEEEFLRSIFVDEDFASNEESRHVFVNKSTQPKSLKRIHSESSDTDAEVASVQYGSNVDTSTMCNKRSNSGNYGVSKMLKSIHGGIHPVSSDQEANKEERMIQIDYWGVETSSCDSTIDESLEGNCVEIFSSPSTVRRGKNKHHPRPRNIISQKTTAKRSQIQKKASINAVSHRD